MIRDFSEFHPVLSALIVAALFSVVPGAFLLVLDILAGGAFNDLAMKILFVYFFVLELLLCFQVERPILWLLPFVMSLLGCIACEIIYTLSMGLQSPGMGPGPLGFIFSSALIILFGCEAAAVVGALFCYGLIAVIRSLFR